MCAKRSTRSSGDCGDLVQVRRKGMIHLIKNYYAAPNNMGFTLLKEKTEKTRKETPPMKHWDTAGILKK